MALWTGISLRGPPSIQRILIAGIVLLILCTAYITTSTSFRSALTNRVMSSGGCPGGELAHEIVVAVKTGATEAEEKVPAIMQTSLRCAPNVLIFSDLEQDVGGYHLYDSLDTITQTVKAHPNFEIYRKQRAEWFLHKNVDAAKGMTNPESNNELAAWTLDKYKNMHIVEKSWELMPDKKWYVLIDADTYLVWDNLLQWLSTMDPTVKEYYGSRIYIAGQPFAHGGSGAVLSGATVHTFAVENNGTAAKWDAQIHNECCGDYMLSKALHEQGNALVDVEPAISGQSPASMPWRDEFWCKPTVTMHHVSPDFMKEVSALERGRPPTSVGTAAAVSFGVHADKQQGFIAPWEIFKYLVKDKLEGMPSPKEDWDNISWKLEPGAGLTQKPDEETKKDSVEACADSCMSNDECYQYMYDGEKCFIGKAFRLGQAREPKDGKKYWSGWRQDKLSAWIDGQQQCDVSTFPSSLVNSNAW